MNPDSRPLFIYTIEGQYIAAQSVLRMTQPFYKYGFEYCIGLVVADSDTAFTVGPFLSELEAREWVETFFHVISEESKP